jgi:hypothetical protein
VSDPAVRLARDQPRPDLDALMERELYLPKPPGHPTAYAAGWRRSMTTAGSGTDCTVGDSAGSYGGTDRVSHAPGQWALENLQGAISLPSGKLPQGPGRPPSTYRGYRPPINSQCASDRSLGHGRCCVIFRQYRRA